MTPRVLLLVTFLFGCDTGEKVDSLQGRVDALETKLNAADEKAKAHEAVATRVAELEKRVATGEAERTAAAEATKADAARIEALRLEVDELKIQAAKLIEAGTKTPPPEEEGSGGSVASGGTLDKVGVPECDEYLEKYAKCIEEKMPASVRETSMDALRKSVDAWKQAGATPAGREALGSACKAALDAAKKAMKGLGCTF